MTHFSPINTTGRKQARPHPQAFWGVFTVFLANGALFGTWVSRIPTIQSNLELGEASLGLVLVGLSLGVLVALSFAGNVIARLGSREVTLGGMSALCLFLPLTAVAPHALVLGALLFLLGGALSTMDVAMNEQAVLVERHAQRRFMSTFHGAFSLGGLAGALLGAGMAALQVSPILHFCVAAALFGTATALTARHLLKTPRQQETSESGKLPVFSFPPRALWPLGLVAFISSISEGTVADWSGVFLTEALGTSTATAALGFAAFSLTMTLGRFTGDRLHAIWNSVSIVRIGGVAAGIGLLLVVFSQHSILTLIGFAGVGLGLANIIPLAFRAAGNSSATSSSAGIAAVATIGYAGFLAGPPLIGFVAETTSLRIAFSLIASMMVPLFCIAAAVSPDHD